MTRFSTVMGVLFVLASVVGPSVAQDAAQTPFDLSQDLGLPSLAVAGENPVTLSGTYKIEKGTRSGQLLVKATMQPDKHIYSLTQKPGGPLPTRITVAESPLVKLTGEFQADRDPLVHTLESYGDLPIEEYSDEVTFTAPFEAAEDADLEQLPFNVNFDGLACESGPSGNCIPVNETVEVSFAGYYESLKATGEYRGDATHVAIRGAIEPKVAAPGSTVKLTLTAQPDPRWHVYARADVDPEKVSKPTLIVLARTAGLTVGESSVSEKPLEEETGLPEQPITYYHEKPVTWTIELQVPRDAEPGPREITGSIGYQTCSKSSCDEPTGLEFRGTVEVANEGGEGSGSAPLAFQPSNYSAVAKLAKSQSDEPQPRTSSSELDLDRLQASSLEESKLPLVYAIAFALLGGFILNFMPCVLPVIGLKILSFVEQAGQSRARIFALNLWYSAGLLAIFMVLATLAVVWNFGWGQQSQYDVFNISMAAVVFVMGLSFLGVWEIPIPGFVGSGKVAELAEKEGASAAFVKGMITTILAVPCSGPGLATALAWCNGKPPAMVYGVFAFMGIGMASPYLIIGANPALVRWLPRPGAWMETFKQLMGFLLLGTIVFIMSYIDWAYLLPTIAFLFGLWLACWWVGRMPLTAEFQVKLRGWLTASAIGLAAWFVSFAWLAGITESRFAATIDREFSQRVGDGNTAENRATEPESPHRLPWEPFTTQRLISETREQKTVLVDFTADWCGTCKTLERLVLNTEEVKMLIDRNGVVPLIADWTKKDEEITAMLQRLGSKQVPVLAIFPAGRPNDPIVFRGGYTKSQLLNKLEEAGPSRDVTASDEVKDPLLKT